MLTTFMLIGFACIALAGAVSIPPSLDLAAGLDWPNQDRTRMERRMRLGDVIGFAGLGFIVIAVVLSK